jgi:TonB family protein
MSGGFMGRGVFGVRRVTVKLLQASALALIVALAVSVRAADERAVQSRVAPVYPEIAKRLKISGVVRLEVTVDADGRVSGVKTVSGNHMLSPAAEDAVRRWKYAPGAGAATVMVDVTFATSN